MKQQEPLSKTKRSQDRSSSSWTKWLPFKLALQGWKRWDKGFQTHLGWGGKTNPKISQVQTRMLAQGCFRSDSKYINHCGVFPVLRKAMEPCLFFANKQDYTVGRTKFGVNSLLSLLIPAAFPSLENPLAIWLKRTAQHKRIWSHLKTATHSPLSPLCSPNLFGPLFWSVKWK